MNEEEGSDYINANYIPVSTETWSVSCTAGRACHLQLAQYLLEAQSHSQHLLQLPIFCLQGTLLFTSHEKKLKGEGGWGRLLANFATAVLGEL